MSSSFGHSFGNLFGIHGQFLQNLKDAAGKVGHYRIGRVQMRIAGQFLHPVPCTQTVVAAPFHQRSIRLIEIPPRNIGKKRLGLLFFHPRERDVYTLLEVDTMESDLPKCLCSRQKE